MFLIMENYVLEWSPVWLHHKIDQEKKQEKKDWNSWLKFSRCGQINIPTNNYHVVGCHYKRETRSYGAFTLDIKSVLNENLSGSLGGTQC
jgi:hypothetical protein